MSELAGSVFLVRRGRPEADSTRARSSTDATAEDALHRPAAAAGAGAGAGAGADLLALPPLSMHPQLSDYDPNSIDLSTLDAAHRHETSDVPPGAVSVGWGTQRARVLRACVVALFPLRLASLL